MDTKSYKNERAIRIRRISGNRSEDSLLDSEYDEDHPVVFTRRRINIDNDDEFSTESSSDEENSGPQKIVWQTVSQMNNNSCHRPWKGDCAKDLEGPYSPVTYFRKLFDSEIISDIVDYTNTYAV